MLTAHTVTLNTNGGTINSGNVTSYTEGTVQTLPTDVTREYYTFDGWFDNAELTGTSVAEIAATETENKSYWAKWTPIEYNITYYDNGDVLNLAPAKYTAQSDTITLPTPTKDNYTFAGWYEDANFGGSAVTQIVKGSGGDKTFYSKWTENAPDTFTVTFDSQKGSAVVAQTVKSGEKAQEPADPARDGHTFVKWQLNGEDYDFNTPVTSSITLTAVWETNTYTVTWKRDDDTIIKQQQMAYGSYPGEHFIPGKPSTAEYEYLFSRWDKAAEIVTGDQTYTAYFTASKRKYSIIWQNDEGDTIDTTQVEYGAMPTHETPVKEPSAEYNYTFAGWTPELVAVTGTATYKATFTYTERTYTVTWKNDDGTILKTDTDVPYGTMPQYTGATPTKAATSSVTYTHSGWTPNVAAVTADVTYTATFASVGQTFNITYNTEHGTAPAADTYTYGVGKESLPTISAVGYTFLGYFTAPGGQVKKESITTTDTGDITLYAKWQVNKPAVAIDYENEKLTGFTSGSYEIDGASVSPSEGKLGAASYIGKTISIVAKGAGYDVDSAAQSLNVPSRPAAPANISSTRESAENASDGTITVGNDFAKLEYKRSTDDVYSPVTSATITGLRGGSYNVRYKATSGAFAGEAADVTVTTHGKETVTFKNDDGSILATLQLNIGETPSYTGTPTKAATAEFTYTFAGWTPEITAVSEGGATYTATYTSVKNKYTVTWVNDDGTELEKDENVEYGTMPEYNGVTPVKAADTEHTYTFKSWDKEIAAVTGDVTYKATYTSAAREYTITWKNGDTTLATTKAAYGTKPSYPSELNEPTKEKDAQYSYTFAGWTPEIADVTGDAEYSARFTSTVNQYTITWNVEGEETTEKYDYGAVPSYKGATPSKDQTLEYTYTFDGWAPEIEPVGADKTYTAKFAGTKRTYTITWYNEDGATVLETNQVDYDTMPEYTGQTPSKADSDTHTYTFSGWMPDIAKVTGDAGYTAAFTETPKTFDITYNINSHGTQPTENLTYTYGTEVTLPTLTAEGWTFGGWYADSEFSGDAVTAVSQTDFGNKTFYAKWTEITKTVTFKIGTEAVKTVSDISAGTTLGSENVPENIADTDSTKFGGWSDGKDTYTAAQLAEYIVNDDTEFTAVIVTKFETFTTENNGIVEAVSVMSDNGTDMTYADLKLAGSATQTTSGAISDFENGVVTYKKTKSLYANFIKISRGKLQKQNTDNTVTVIKVTPNNSGIQRMNVTFDIQCVVAGKNAGLTVAKIDGVTSLSDFTYSTLKELGATQVTQMSNVDDSTGQQRSVTVNLDSAGYCFKFSCRKLWYKQFRNIFKVFCGS